jgi:hypothetical protein
VLGAAPPIGVAVSGRKAVAGRHVDAMIGGEPRAELGQMFDDAGGSGKPRIGQIALSYDPDQLDWQVGPARRRNPYQAGLRQPP